MKIPGEFSVNSLTPVLSFCIFLSLCILQNAHGYHVKPSGASLEGGLPRHSGGDHAAELKRRRAPSVPAGQPGASLVESSTSIPILTFDMMSDDDKKLARRSDVDWLCRTTTEDGGCSSREHVIGGELVVKGVCPPGYCCSRIECNTFGCGDVCVKTTHKSCKYSALHNAKYSDGNCSCTRSNNFKCSAHAECLEFPSTPEFAGGVKCRCMAGYVGDGIDCRLPSDASTTAEPRGVRVGIRAGGNLGGRGALTGGINGSLGVNLGGGGPIGLTVRGGSSGSYSHGSTGGTDGVTGEFGAGAGGGGNTPAGGHEGGAGTGSGAGTVPFRGRDIPAPRVHPPDSTPPAPLLTPEVPPASVPPKPTVHPPSDVSRSPDVPSPPETGGGGKALIGGLGKVVSALTSGGGVAISGGIGGSISAGENGSIGGHLSPHLSVTANGGAGVSGGVHGGSSQGDSSKGTLSLPGIHVRIPTSFKLPRFGFSASVGGDAGVGASKWTQNTGAQGYSPSTEASQWTQNTGGKGYEPRRNANAEGGLEEGAEGDPETPGGAKRPTGILTHAYEGVLPVPSASEAGAPACEGSPCGAGECIALSATTYSCVCPQDYLLVEHPGVAYCVHLNYGQSISLMRQ